MLTGKDTRIAFMGASGVGKTTLAEWLCAELGIEMNPVGARSTASIMGFSSPYDVDRACAETYYDDVSEQLGIGSKAAVSRSIEDWADNGTSMREIFQRKLQADKIAWESDKLSFCTDRSTLDDAAYAYIHCEAIRQDTAFMDKSFSGFNVYTHVVFIDMSHEILQALQSDPARVLDLEYHKKFENLLKELHHKYTQVTPREKHPEFLQLAVRDLSARKARLRLFLQSRGLMHRAVTERR